MASNPFKSQKKAKSSKRKQGECSQATLNRLDTWFIDESKKNDFKMIYVVKNVRIPKYLDLERFSRQGFNFPCIDERNFLFEAGESLLSCAHADLEGNLFSTINGVKMVIDAEVQKAIARLDLGGVHKFEESTDGYSKM